MKVWGAVCILFGALYSFLQFRQQMTFAIHLKRSLVSDLAVLKNGVCVYHRTIPAICDVELKNSFSAPYLWIPLRKFLQENNHSAQWCWEKAACDLPDSIGLHIGMLGPLLGRGGEGFARAVDEVRENLLEDIRAEESRMSSSLRLSGACFLILILV